MKSMKGRLVLEPVFTLGLLAIAACCAWVQPDAAYPLVLACFAVGSLLRAMLPVNEGVLSEQVVGHWNRAEGLYLAPKVERGCLAVLVLAGAAALTLQDRNLQAAAFALGVTALALRLSASLPVWAKR